MYGHNNKSDDGGREVSQVETKERDPSQGNSCRVLKWYRAARWYTVHSEMVKEKDAIL